MRALLHSISILSLLLFTAAASQAQSKIDKRFPISKGQKLVIDVDFPTIKIHTWNEKDIRITGSVSINRGEHDDAFSLDAATSGNVVTITSAIKDEDNIPRRILIKHGDTEYYFRTGDVHDPEVQKFLDEHGHSYGYMTTGIIRDIQLEIFVPAGLETAVKAKFGLVEVTSFDGPITVDAKFGGVDASVPVKQIGQVTARTKFGEILTNLDVKFESTSKMEDPEHWINVTAKTGSGPAYAFASQFGKVYLRKP